MTDSAVCIDVHECPMLGSLYFVQTQRIASKKLRIAPSLNRSDCDAEFSDCSSIADRLGRESTTIVSSNHNRAQE
jgi:hypothetical protein